MYPFLPTGNLDAAIELVCCFATALTAIVSFLFTMRA